VILPDVNVLIYADGNAAMARGRWVYVGGRAGTKPSAADKLAITAACEKLIVDVLRPRCLPEVRPTQFNYPIAISGKWHGNKFRFITRYRSGHADNLGEEFDAPFARLEYVSPDRFDISYFRHTEEWFCLHRSVTLAQALRLIESEGLLHPP
jgi:hypothetical protein